MTIPGVTHPHVQQEPPAEMLGWWATDKELGRVLCISATQHNTNGAYITTPQGERMYLAIGDLSDWSRERDIEGAGCSD